MAGIDMDKVKARRAGLSYCSKALYRQRIAIGKLKLPEWEKALRRGAVDDVLKRIQEIISDEDARLYEWQDSHPKG